MMFMIGVRWWLFGCFFALFLPATAGEILGNILITKGLTKRKVTLFKALTQPTSKLMVS